MSGKAFTIGPFRRLPPEAEIIGVGQVSQPKGPANEPLFAILLANGLDADDPLVCTTKIVGGGQLDLLTVGSRWTKGHHVGDAPAIEMSADVSFLTSCVLGAGIDEPESTIRRFPSETIESAPCFRVELTNLTTSAKWKPRLATIPVTEVARALFAPSSPFLQQVVDGLRDGRVATDRAFVDRARSGRSPTEPSTVVLWCQRELDHREAVIMAAMLTDEKIRRSHDSVFQRLSVDADWRIGKPVWLSMDWPFSKPVRCWFEGRLYQHARGKPFLVTRITKMDLPIAFDTIEMHHLGAEEGPADGDVPFRSTRLRARSKGVARLETGKPSSGSRRSTTIASRDVEMISAANVMLRSIAHGGSANPSSSELGGDRHEDNPVSTSARESGADPGIGRAVVKRSDDGLPADHRDKVEALVATLAAIRLCARRERWRITEFPSSRRVTGQASDPFDFPAEMLLVQVGTNHGVAIIADVGSSTGDPRSLGVLVGDDRSSLDASGVSAIRKAGVELGGSWRRRGAEVPGFVLTTMSRQESDWGDPEAYASSLAKKIRSALGARKQIQRPQPPP